MHPTMMNMLPHWSEMFIEVKKIASAVIVFIKLVQEFTEKSLTYVNIASLLLFIMQIER